MKKSQNDIPEKNGSVRKDRMVYIQQIFNGWESVGWGSSVILKWNANCVPEECCQHLI